MGDDDTAEPDEEPKALPIAAAEEPSVPAVPSEPVPETVSEPLEPEFSPRESNPAGLTVLA